MVKNINKKKKKKKKKWEEKKKGVTMSILAFSA
jgi:hypothetical protein